MDREVQGDRIVIPCIDGERRLAGDGQVLLLC